MIYKDIVNKQNSLKHYLNKFDTTILDFKKILMAYKENINIIWNNIPTSGNYNTTSLQQSSNSKKNFNSTLTNFNFNMIDYISNLNKLKDINKDNETSLNFDEFIKEFSDFLDLLQNYLHRQKSTAHIPNLILALSKIVNSYDSIMNEIEIILKYDTLLENQNYSNDNEVLELQFYDKLKTTEIIYILEALPDLYSRGLHLLGLEESEFPFEIIKLESGSWFQKIKGNVTVIGLITLIFNQAIEDLYVSYSPLTIAKQRRELSNFEYLEKKLNIRKLLKEQGFDTSTMDEELNQYLAKSYKTGKEIATKSNKIRINKDIIQLDDIYKIKLLEDKNKQLSLSYTPQRLNEENNKIN